MNPQHHELYSHAIGAAGVVASYGHYGRPLLAFPSEGGRAYDWQDNGMIDAIGDLLEAGRVKLYCVSSFDSESWSNQSIPLEQRAREHGRYESWILDEVVPFIQHDTGGEIMTAGISLGAFHAANFALKRADLFPLALCMSGNYDPSTLERLGRARRADLLQQPARLRRPARRRPPRLAALAGLSLLLVCGQGQWEDTTGSLESTKRLAGMLAEKNIRHELDLWGYDVPHDWPSWRAQIAHHLPRFC